MKDDQLTKSVDKRPENGEISAEERIKANQFKPGNPGGPGRPKGSRSFNTILSQVAELEAPDRFIEKLKESGVELPERSWLYVLSAVALAKAAGGSVRHLEIVLDRMMGKAVQPINANLNVINLDSASEEVKKLVAEFGLLGAKNE